MKKILSICLLVCVVITTFAAPYTASAADSENHIVMAYNINGALLTINANEIAGVVKNYNPDLIAFNEVNDNNEPVLVSAMKQAGYDYFGTSDWDPTSPEATIARACWRNYVFYKTDKYQLLDSGTFSISDTPENLHAFISTMDLETKQKKEGRPRNCNWVYLASKATNDRFIFSSAHVQWASNADGSINYNTLGLTYLATQLVALSNKYNCEIICGGDMNGNSDQMGPVTSMGLSTANPGVITYPPETSSIDNVFYTSGFTSSGFKVGTEYDYSDHKPIVVTMSRSNIPVRYELSCDIVGNGKVELDVKNSTSTFLKANETTTFKVVPEDGYSVSSIKIDGTPIEVKNGGAEYEYEYKMPAKASKIEVLFEGVKYNVTSKITSGKGTVGIVEEGKTENIIAVGEEFKIYVTPAEGFKVSVVKVNSKKLGIENEGKSFVYSYTMEARDTKVSVTFVREPSGTGSAVSTTKPKPTFESDANSSGVDNSNNDKENSNFVIILFCIVGGIVIVAGIAVLVIVLVKKKKNKAV